VFVNGTLEVRTYTLRNGSVFNTIYGRFNNTWAGRNIVYNNTNQVKTYFNNSVFFNGTIQVRTYTLRNGSNFDVIYGNQGPSSTGISNNTDQGKVYLNSSN
ncbi:MAG: hypothetical protein AABY15_04315, partial [Nanoarchaeota archaeon]